MSLRTKIIAILLFFSTLPVVVIGLIETNKIQESLQEQIGTSSLEYTRLSMQRMNEFLYMTWCEDVQSWPHGMGLGRIVEPGFCNELSGKLEHMLEVHDEYYYAVVTDLDGRVVAASNPELLSRNLSGIPGFKKASTGTPDLQDVALDPIAEEYALVISAPVMNNDHTEVVGMLSAALKWHSVNEMIVGLKVAGHKQSDENHLILINRDGLVLSCVDGDGVFTENLAEFGMKSAQYALEEKEGYLLDELTEHGGSSFTAYTYQKDFKDLPNLHWRLLLQQDPDHLFASINSLKRATVYTILIFVGILSVVAFVFADRLSRPISAISSAAQALGQGDLDTRVPVTGHDEIGILSESFNTMAQNVQQSNDSLQDAIEQQKRAESALENLNYDLIKTVDKLEDSNQELRDFVYIASHDLREPLRKISSFGMLLKDSLEGNLSEDDSENMEFMIDGAVRMTQMIEGLLVYSRISRDETEAETVDLNEVAQQLQELEIAELIEETGAEIGVAPSLPVVSSSPAAVRQLLQNLITNAIRYRKPDTSPHIEISAEQTGDDEVRVEVRDNGIGIKDEFHEAIFKMFKRLHSRQEYEGTGIGLAVCKKIVERQNGQIGVESEPGQGTTAYFTLPAAKQLAEAVS
ncbi:MAG: HAMP domain-containing protein [Planctomycetes bacterium]|nr:HAMP domain-containing protein [Planctomycetota bacterium]